jgi:hypothetical protein
MAKKEDTPEETIKKAMEYLFPENFIENQDYTGFVLNSSVIISQNLDDTKGKGDLSVIDKLATEKNKINNNTDEGKKALSEINSKTGRFNGSALQTFKYYKKLYDVLSPSDKLTPQEKEKRKEVIKN